MRLISILSLLFLALIVPVSPQVNDARGVADFSQAPYEIGESLSYNVSYSNFPSVAHVQVQVVSRVPYAGRDSLELRAHAETTEIINVALLALNNDYTTFVDPDTGLPLHSQVVTHQGAKETESSRDFTQIADPGDSKRSSVAGIYDFLSAFYRLRALPLTLGSSYSMLVKGENETYSMEVRVVDRQSVKTSVSSFNTIVAQLHLSSVLVKNGRIYFSDDPRHIPVLITAKVGTGELRIELVGSEILGPPPVAYPTPAPTPKITPEFKPTPTPSIPSTAIAGDLPFKIGEQLNYQIYLGQSTMVVGLASFQVRGRSRYFEQDGLWLSVTAQTTGPVQKLFVANDQLDSYVDPTSLLPYHSQFKLIEGRRRLNQTLSFNQDRGVATTDKRERIEIPVGTHDYISFFYAMRTFDIVPPKQNAISILVENKPKTLFITALKREVIQLREQKVPAIALALTTDDAQTDKYQIRIWVSDDRRRLPLRITSVTELGPVQADLAILPTTPQ